MKPAEHHRFFHPDMPARPRKNEARKRRAHLRTEFRLALMVLALATALKFWLADTGLGRALNAQANVWLQGHLARPANASLPVVVDIIRLKPTEFEISRRVNDPGTNGPLKIVAQRESFTPRDKLEALINRIAEGLPTAVGVDIDLALEPEIIWPTGAAPADSLFTTTSNLLETARQLSTRTEAPRVPVFLGIKRTDALPPDQWFGDWPHGERYAAHAVSLARPKGLVEKMPSEFQFPDHNRRLPGLARALVATNRAQFSPRWLEHIAHQIAVETPLKHLPDFKMHEYPVDFSRLEEIMAGTIQFDQLPSDPVGAFRNRLVLVGDATFYEGADTANVPGRGEPVPGVFVHACAAYTLAAAPLLEFNKLPGVLLAVLASYGALRLVHYFCQRAAGRLRVTTVPLTILATVVLMLFFLALAWAAVRWWHLLWLEVIVVCVVLAVDCLLEIFLTSLNWKRLAKNPAEALVADAQDGH